MNLDVTCLDAASKAVAAAVAVDAVVVVDAAVVYYVAIDVVAQRNADEHESAREFRLPGQSKLHDGGGRRRRCRRRRRSLGLLFVVVCHRSHSEYRFRPMTESFSSLNELWQRRRKKKCFRW